MTLQIPTDRVQARAPDKPIRADRSYVLYWMTAQRRTQHNFGLQHAIAHCVALNKPLVVLEALRIGYPWASPRLHAFVVEGMRDNGRVLDAIGVTRVSHVEEYAGASRGLLTALAADAAVVVADAFPCFFLPKMLTAAADKLDVRLEEVDSNGLYPLSASDRLFTTAASFRRHLQKTITPHLHAFPIADPLRADGVASVVRGAVLPERVDAQFSIRVPSDLGALGLTGPAPVPMTGGAVAGTARLDTFLADKLGRYPVDRNLPLNGAASGLSPYLHFGHVGTHQIMARVFDAEGFTPWDTPPKATGSRAGWWGLSEAAESFIDELITWRELGFNRCHNDPAGYDKYETLPDWARTTLAEHAQDPRPHVYTLAEFEAAQTHDPVWNAAQRQLLEEGVIHNYLRMLWGKKILHWTPDPRVALDVMLELNNRYAIDGRDPNSYSGIFWTLGRFDRAWGPERPVFGKIRYMTSQSTQRKLKLADYLKRYGPQQRLV